MELGGIRVLDGIQTILTIDGATLNFEENISLGSGSSLKLVSSNNGLLSKTGTIGLSGGGDLILSDDFEVAASLDVGASSTLEGTGIVTGDLTLLSEGKLSPGESGTGTMTVTGDVGGTGTWVFDVVDSLNTDRIDVFGTGDLVISSTTLNLSGRRDTSGGPIVIATYGGSDPLPFATVNGLLDGQSITYTGGQIAITGGIVPEVTGIVPLSLAFLPLLTMRKRRVKK